MENFKFVINEYIKSSVNVKQLILQNPEINSSLISLAKNCSNTLRLGGKIIFAGNGGSFADAQHLSAEFISRFLNEREPIASIALGTNSSSFSAIGNDYGFENVFSRELKAIGKSSDIFIPITTSGQSLNILKSIETAIDMKLKTVCFTGCEGGEVVTLCDCIIIPSSNTALIQESHIMLGHILCQITEQMYLLN